MVIDLDDDDPPPQTAVPEAEFEDEEEELDAAKPYRRVLRYIDISLDDSALCLAVPTGPQPGTGIFPDIHPSILKTRIVFAVGCSDYSIQLVTLPLTPPRSAFNDPAQWNVERVGIVGSNSHRDLVTSISMTFTAEISEEARNVEDRKSRSRSRGGQKPASVDKYGRIWSIIVATTSCTGNGLLLIHQIPILNETKIGSNSEDLIPTQRHYLKTNLSKCFLSFNPSQFPAERHLNLLIGLPYAGCVRLYQAIDFSTPTRGRRSSGATRDSSVSSSKSLRNLSSQPGKFLITLFTGFSHGDDNGFAPSRRRILDAAWVLGGRAVAALLEGGEWGVWDVEGTGPSSASSTQNLLKGKGNVSGVQGGSITKFAIRGSVAISHHDVVTAIPRTISSKTGDLVPMTPHTRKSHSEGLFRGTETGLGTSTHQSSSTYGAICVIEQTATDQPASSRLLEEMVILSYQEMLVLIPSLLAYWRSEVSGHGSFGATGTVRPVILPSLRHGGEEQNSLGFISAPKTSIGYGVASTIGALDLFVATQGRLILSTSPHSDSEESKPQEGLAQSSIRANGSNSPSDQHLLDQGLLDVDGMDRILDGMANGEVVRQTSGPFAFGKSGGSHIGNNEDVEMTMGSPSPSHRVRSIQPTRVIHPPSSRGFGTSQRSFT